MAALSAERRARFVMPATIPPTFLSHRVAFGLSIAEARNGRLAKRLASPTTGNFIPPVPEYGVRDIEKALRAFEKNPQAIGIGIILGGKSDIICVDFDHALDPFDGWHPAMLDWIKMSTSFAEVSSSGEGVHLFLSEKNAEEAYPNFGRRSYQGLLIERYSSKRFISLTFDKFPGCGNEVANGGLVLSDIETAIGETADRSSLSSVGLPESVEDIPYPRMAGKAELPDQHIISICRRANNRHKFNALFDKGNLSYFDGDHSRADQALIGMIAFYAQSAVQIERIFGMSALGQREKWHGRLDYRIRCISFAIRQNEQRA
ncbi:MAG: hypothetical protein J0L89_07720 [Xanthomonadales bacterium]|nr:hypothetical protein [Xanthomonadales bacterium]